LDSNVSKRKIKIEQEKRLRELWEGAKNSAGCPVHDAAKWEAKILVSQLKALREIVKDNEERMKMVAKQYPEYLSLLSIPGFGPIVSAMVLGAIGNPSRFEN
jgi:transposase